MRCMLKYLEESVPRYTPLKGIQKKGLKDGWGETLTLSLAGERTGTMSGEFHRKVLGKHPGSNTNTSCSVFRNSNTSVR